MKMLSATTDPITKLWREISSLAATYFSSQPLASPQSHQGGSDKYAKQIR